MRAALLMLALSQDVTNVPGVQVQQVGSSVGQATKLNCSGAGITCTKSGSTATLTVPGSSGGAPGGVAPQVQYNYDGGGFAGMTNYTTDGVRPIVTAETSMASTPSAGTARRQDWAPTTAFPGIPMSIDGQVGAIPLGIVGVFGKGSANNNWNYFCYAMPYQTSNPPIATNIAALTATNWASNTASTYDSGYVGQMPWIQGATAATGNSTSNLATPGKMAYTGPAAGMGGFVWWQRVHINESTSHTRQFYGLTPNTTAFTTAEPSSVANTVYFGSEQNQATLHICSNNTSATASCADLGLNFPSAPDAGANGAAVLSNQFYDMWLASGPNTTLSDGGTGIAYYVENISTGNTASGTVTSQLPDHGILMGVLDELNSADSGVIAQGYFNGMCLAYSY